MRKPNSNGGLRAEEVASEDIIRLFGEVETETLLAISALHPTTADVEEVALRLTGDGEAVGRKQATGVVAEILDLIDTGEDEDTTSVEGAKRI